MPEKKSLRSDTERIYSFIIRDVAITLVELTKDNALFPRITLEAHKSKNYAMDKCVIYRTRIPRKLDPTTKLQTLAFIHGVSCGIEKFFERKILNL